jgi:hypothetical protein
MTDFNIINSIRNNDFISFSDSGVLNFYGIDSCEFFNKNLKTQPEDWYYRQNSVQYTLNDSGYRTKNFEDIDWKNSMVMFGCSHVFGVGNDDRHTITHFLEELTGIPVINMGFPGASMQFCLHNSLMLYKKYGVPKSAIYFWTGITRNLFYQRESVIMNTSFEDIREHPASAIAAIEESTGTTLKSVDDPRIFEHIVPFNMVNVELIRNMWKDRCPLYEFSTFPTTSKILECEFYEPIPNDYARDLAHFGRHTNKLFAENICKNLNI